MAIDTPVEPAPSDAPHHAARLLPPWLRAYRREWLRPDVVAGLVVWSVVVPQAVAYAQIAGLPPGAGLMAAPGALVGYALLGTSRTLVVGATTATAALSASAIGPLANGDAGRFVALSAALALVTAGVLVCSGLLRLGAVADLISKPVMTGFLFGLGITIAVGQLSKVLGVEDPGGDVIPRLWNILGELGDVDGATVAVGGLSIVLLVVLRRVMPAVPGVLVVLVLSIVVSWLLDLKAHGVSVVGKLPSALPDPSIPDIHSGDIAALIGTGFGVMFLSTEGIGVARGLATRDGYTVDASRELVAFGGANLLSGLSQGFVQSGGASQTAAADRAGGRTQLASIVAAALVLLTGAFLAPLFEDLPQAALGAIVIVAVSGFWRVDELRRFAHLQRSAVGLALAAIAGVLALGVLPGLIVAAALSLVLVIKRLSRPSVGTLGRDPGSGVWGRVDRHPGWQPVAGVTIVRTDGPLFYANAVHVREWILATAQAEGSGVVVVDLSTSTDLDVESLDTLDELAEALERRGVDLRFASVHRPAATALERSGLADRLLIAPSIDDAVDGTRQRGVRRHHPHG